jgi:hypothetical protein
MSSCIWTVVAVLFVICGGAWTLALWVALGPRKAPPRCEPSQETLALYDQLRRKYAD